MTKTLSHPPELTDQTALARNRARARRSGFAGFLHDEAIVEIQERVGMVNRRFTSPAIVTAFPDVWAGALPHARMIVPQETLSLAPEAHDLVIHAMALHWANDPLGQIIQCARALRPDGLFLAVMPGGRTLSELRSSLADAEARLSGGLSPRVLPMAEIRDLGGLLSRTGLALPVADSVPVRTSYRDLFHLAHDLRAMGEQSALAARPRRFAPRALFVEAAQTYARNFPEADGRIAATFDLMFLSGWTAHPDQPKPLRPGSAITRLADALNVPKPQE